MRKQKLSPEASKAKAIRDKKIAMTGHRKKRKNENERMGQRSDSDIHHTKDGKQVRVPIKDNRGNFGKGTKSEGPNMMGQTWLNKRIKGPNAEGDPVKKKYVKGGETNQFHPNFVPPPKGTIMPITGGYTPPHFKEELYNNVLLLQSSPILLGKSSKVVRPFPYRPKKTIRPKDTISKMHIGKLKSKSTTPKELESRQNMKMLEQTVMGTRGKKEIALSYQKRKGLTDNQMYSTFPGLKPSKTK